MSPHSFSRRIKDRTRETAEIEPRKTPEWPEKKADVSRRHHRATSSGLAKCRLFSRANPPGVRLQNRNGCVVDYLHVHHKKIIEIDLPFCVQTCTACCKLRCHVIILYSNTYMHINIIHIWKGGPLGYPYKRSTTWTLKHRSIRLHAKGILWFQGSSR